MALSLLSLITSNLTLLVERYDAVSYYPPLAISYGDSYLPLVYLNHKLYLYQAST